MHPSPTSVLNRLSLFRPAAIAAVVICIIGAPAALGQIVNPGFEAGNTGFTSGYAFGNVSEPGTYTVGTSSAAVAGSFGDWQAFGDHTTGTGMMMIVNGGTDSGALVWSETVPVSPKTNYRFSFWGATLNADSGSPASIQVKINGASVGKGNVFPGASPPAGGAWTRFTVTWNSGPATTATISLFDLNTSTGWNDFALDDISLTGEPVKAEKK